MYAIITAGGVLKEGDALYDVTGEGQKVLLEIAGKPILQWVLDAVSQSQTIEQIVIVGLSEVNSVKCRQPITNLEAHGSLLENIESGINKVQEIDPHAQKMILISGDLPGISGEMIDWMADFAAKSDNEFLYPLIERSLMEYVFPGAKRTYVRLREGEFCGGDLMGISASMVKTKDLQGRKLVESRKNPLKQAWILGLDMCLRLAVGRLSLARDVPIICRRLGITGKAVISPFAEIAMDIDKPQHISVMEKYLALKKGTA